VPCRYVLRNLHSTCRWCADIHRINPSKPDFCHCISLVHVLFSTGTCWLDGTMHTCTAWCQISRCTGKPWVGAIAQQLMMLSKGTCTSPCVYIVPARLHSMMCHGTIRPVHGGSCRHHPDVACGTAHSAGIATAARALPSPMQLPKAALLLVACMPSARRMQPCCSTGRL